MAQRDEQQRAGGERKAGMLRTLSAVLWAFLGVRRKSDYEKDSAGLNPVLVIIVGVLAAALFVIVLIFVARSAAG